MSDKPTSSVPEASGTWAETKATYDFGDSPYIKPAQLRKGHVDATLSRIPNHQIIGAIQDTTELNYTTHKAVKRVGYLDSKYAHGLKKVHSTLAATTQGLPLFRVFIERFLLEEMELVEPQATITVELNRNPTRPSREATLTIRYKTLTIQPTKSC